MAQIKVKFFKVLGLPSEPEANALYFIESESSYEVYITDEDGNGKIYKDAALTALVEELSDSLEQTFTAHEADSNPHPVYLTQNEGDALYKPLPPTMGIYINCGSATTYGRWIGDTGKFNVGTALNSGNSAWQANTPLRAGMSQNGEVYQYLRFHNATMPYTLGGFTPNTSVLLRIHSGDAGYGFQQSINVNGVEIQAAYVLQTDAGGAAKIGIKTYTVTTDAAGRLVVAFVPQGGGQAAVSAIEAHQPVPTPSYSQIHAAGDSITAGGGIIAATETWVNQLAILQDANHSTGAGTTYIRGYDETRKKNYHTVARSGDRIDQQETIAGTQINPLKSANNGFEIVLLTCGINDILQGASAATIQSRLTSYFASLTTGFIKAIGTITPTAGAYSLSGGQETIRQTVNTWIRANSLQLDFIVDFAGDSRLQNAADTAIYYDGLHNTIAGQEIRADIVNTSLQSFSRYF